MKVITISREYGAGGHSVGCEVAKRLGIEIYDEDIIRGAAKEAGLDEEFIRQAEEKVSGLEAFLRGITPISYEQKDAIFEVESKVITGFAKQGPCVILGRCGDAVLHEAGIETLDVFLYADADHKEARIAELLGESSRSAVRKAIKTVESSRRSYYSYYTEKTWGDYRNYDLMLDTGALGIDACVDIICRAAQD